ncbi:energy transducer TonB [Antarcticibacterium sp. 1MA-6-2]|uniref:energy transducer TonB n=1 Tax=Antarcticibacterium sp. 1MA-6-2 TaxID=2908210 RepID=UPI001F2893AF|nr:energy transducer TonB [Antarcticibacterium sp. 1MA-6-2]UJH90777.1 energy transducer TonB [Antarcticibacterium sp. 1MA-6-2]
MLQKSESKAIAKTKFLVVLPLMLIMLSFTGYSFEQQIGSIDTSSKDLVIEVKDLDQLSVEQKRMLENKVSLVMEKRAYKSLVVKDDKKTLEFSVDPVTGEQQGKISPNPGTSISSQPVPDVPFAVVGEAPVYPGCEKFDSSDARKNCMAEKVTNFVKTNISEDTVNLFTQPEGGNVTVVFRIDETGKVTGAKARATSPKLDVDERSILEREAIKAVNSLPQMEPGKHNGQVAGVLYAVR